MEIKWISRIAFAVFSKSTLLGRNIKCVCILWPVISVLLQWQCFSSHRFSACVHYDFTNTTVEFELFHPNVNPKHLLSNKKSNTCLLLRWKNKEEEKQNRIHWNKSSQLFALCAPHFHRLLSVFEHMEFMKSITFGGIFLCDPSFIVDSPLFHQYQSQWVTIWHFKNRSSTQHTS